MGGGNGVLAACVNPGDEIGTAFEVGSGIIDGRGDVVIFNGDAKTMGADGGLGQLVFNQAATVAFTLARMRINSLRK